MKHYLSGMDWILHSLEGNEFSITAELSGSFDEGLFKPAFERFCGLFPQMRGRIRRAVNLAPYWGFPASSPQLTPVRYSVSEEGGRTFLRFTFDHLLFDARGAEIFLHEFQNWFLSHEKIEVPVVSPAPACLDRWGEQFSAGKKVNRARIAREKRGVPAGFTGVSTRAGKACFKVRTFSETETREVFKRCEEKAGPFMFLPYSLAFAVRAMAALFAQRGLKGDLVIPVTRDMRADTAPRRMLFNQLSFLFFTAPAKESRFENILKDLQVQFYEQAREKTAEALWDAAMLVRIVPRPVLSRFLRCQKGNPKESFSFASLGESAFRHETLTGARVENLVHRPCVPFPPGAGIFFTQFHGKLNLTFSYHEGLASEREAEEVLMSAGAL